MRNYIILNGVNSNTITGLLISKLPPITKPKIRTQTEEIDGRDGDIVTKLGYSAYDKEIEIGLYGNFDINEVIAYFNTEGTIVFSNEADKYYNYQILDQIDYEKLIRFKTAKVKMHVQPFKYPLEETPIEINIQNVTGSGETISLDNTAEAPVTLALKGNTSQDGTPTPTAPIEVQTVTGRQEIDIVGKNLLTINVDSGTTKNGLTITKNVDGSYTLNGTTTANTTWDLYNGDNITLSEGTYTASIGDRTNIVDGYIRLNNGSYQTVFDSGHDTNTFTITQPFTFNRFYIYIASGKTFNNQIIKPQLEAGSTATTYEPYQSQSYELDLGNLELCKIGDYQDYIYKDNNKWYLHKETEKLVLDGSTDEAWNYRNNGRFDIEMPSIDGSYSIVGLSNRYAYQESWNTHLATDYSFTIRNGNWGANKCRMSFINTNFSGTAPFRAELLSNNVFVYYALTSQLGGAKEIQITDTILIGQLNALENARSYDTTTHINQNTANKPFIINATAVQKGSDTGNVDNIGNIYAKPNIDIEGSGIVEIYLDGNQIFNVDLSTINECVIDTTNLEAYNPATTQLMNRQVTGDYSNFKINVGDNQVKVSGAVTKATISNYTRWL